MRIVKCSIDLNVFSEGTKMEDKGKEEMAMNVDLQDLIQQLACELYVKSGKAEGRDLNNWIEAEWIIKNRFERTKELNNIFAEETR